MSPESLEQTIGRLTRELRPVRRVTPIRVGWLWALAAGLAGAALGGGLRADWAVRLAGVGPFPAVALGLALAAAGGMAAGLASAVPGRETAARSGGGLVAGGLGLAVLALAAAALVAGGGAALWNAPPPGAADLRCLVRALLLALPPAGALGLWVVRAVPLRPGASAALVGAGSGALGALAVHFACPADALRHVLLGHVLAPVCAALLLAGATQGMAWLWRRGARPTRGG